MLAVQDQFERQQPKYIEPDRILDVEYGEKKEVEVKKKS